MTYVPGFKYDVFISYAHFDNEADSQDIRWVSRFQSDLKNALRQRLGEDPGIFYDERDLAAYDSVDFLLENARRSAVFLAVFSPSYTARQFTIQELAAFCERPRDAMRIVTVELLPVAESKHHPLLRGRKRTPFWWKDKTEEDIPLRLTPRFNPEMYNERLQVLAHHLKKLMAEMREHAASATAPSEPSLPSPQRSGAGSPRTVLLAQGTDDLYDECERVRAYLEQFGLTVLPENAFPQGGVEFAAALEADLARAGLFVQLLGRFASRRPPDLPQTYSQYQYETAKRHGLKVFQWRHPDLDIAAVTHQDRKLLEGPDVLAVGLEEFKSDVLRCATQPSKPETQPGGDCHVFINADRSDKELADALLKLFENKRNCTAARPLFEGSAKEITDDLDANLVNCGALLLLYGQAPPAWVRAQLLRYNKVKRLREEPLRLKTIVLGPPTPKGEIAWSGGFDMIDCQDGDIVQHVEGILDDLRL
jgi:hypothetical protein